MWIQYKKICGYKCNICGYSKTNYVGLICLKDVPQTSWNDVSNTFCHQVSYDVFLWCHLSLKCLGMMSANLFLPNVLWCLTVMSPSKIFLVWWCLTVMSPSKICQKFFLSYDVSLWCHLQKSIKNYLSYDVLLWCHLQKSVRNPSNFLNFNWP